MNPSMKRNSEKPDGTRKSSLETWNNRGLLALAALMLTLLHTDFYFC